MDARGIKGIKKRGGFSYGHPFRGEGAFSLWKEIKQKKEGEGIAPFKKKNRGEGIKKRNSTIKDRSFIVL